MKRNLHFSMKSQDLLNDFADYCLKNPEERFWQVLRNWSGKNFILASDASSYERRKELAEDTFYWEARNGPKRSVSTD